MAAFRAAVMPANQSRRLLSCQRIRLFSLNDRATIVHGDADGVLASRLAIYDDGTTDLLAF